MVDVWEEPPSTKQGGLVTWGWDWSYVTMETMDTTNRRAQDFIRGGGEFGWHCYYFNQIRNEVILS